MTISDGDVHQPADCRLHERLVVNPARDLLAVRPVGRPQPCRGLGHDPLAEGEPAWIVHTIHLAGNPAETTHAATHAATHTTATHATTHAHAAVHAIGAAQAATGLKRIHARAGVDGQHEVRDRIDLHDQVLLGFFLRRDEQHFVLNEIRQFEVAEQQPQGRPQGNAREVLRDRRIEVEARILERLLIEFDRNAVGIADLGDDIAKRRLVELESGDRFVERRVDLLLLAARVRQVDRLILFTKSCDLFPSLSAGVDDRWLVGVWDAAHVGQVEHIHEAPLLIAANAGVLSVVVENPGHEWRGPADDAGCHRNRVVGVEIWGFHGDLLRHVPLRPHKGIGRLLVAHANALLDECVVALGELLDLLLPALQLARESSPLAADGGPSLVGEVALHLLP